MAIRQITIVGTGLIGGSLGLALRHSGFTGALVGCDKPAVLERAIACGAVERGTSDPVDASDGSDVVVLATPVGAILSLFEKIAPVISPDTLITDTGSTKEQFAQRARMILGESAGVRVLPGHPMAGREVGGIDNAVPELFRDAAWLITPLGSGENNTPRQQEYLELVRAIGARVIVMDPDRHDRLCAWVSHLPQMMATALATALRQELGDDEAVSQIGGRALREMTRIAHSPYSMWRDIALTNTGNIEEAILRFEQELAHLRENLRGPGLREMFESANKWPVVSGQLSNSSRTRSKLKEGDLVRVARVPEAVRDSVDFKTRSILEQCVGRAFPIMGINQYGLIQIDVGETVGKPSYMESIWIEADCVEPIGE